MHLTSFPHPWPVKHLGITASLWGFNTWQAALGLSTVSSVFCVLHNSLTENSRTSMSRMFPRSYCLRDSVSFNMCLPVRVCVYVRLTNGRISRSKTKQKSAMHQSEFLFVGSLHYFDHMSIRCYSCQGLGAQNVNNVRRRKASMRNLICEDYLSIDRAIDRSIDLSIYRSIDLSIYLIYRSIICCSKSCSSKWYRKRN